VVVGADMKSMTVTTAIFNVKMPSPPGLSASDVIGHGTLKGRAEKVTVVQLQYDPSSNTLEHSSRLEAICLFDAYSAFERQFLLSDGLYIS
jgi:hypothetical protein